jgi:hypothetical protein
MQQLHMTLTMHKAQPWQEALSQAQQDRTIMRSWEEALSQCSSCCCGLGYSYNSPPPLGITDMKFQPTDIPLKWLLNEPMWVDQWPLSGQKLQQAHILVQQKVKAGYVEPSNSPWNSPVFLIEKKAKGKYRLIHDL